MTDIAIKELMARLEVSHERRDKELDKLIAQNEVAQAKIAIAQAKTDQELDKLIAQNEIAQAKNEIAQAEIAASFKKTEELLKNLGIHIGGMANSQGQSTEEYFYNSLVDNKRLGNIQFDEISKNLHYKKDGIEDEFDITLFNGNNIALIECKYSAKEEDVVKLINKKVSNFRKLFPHYFNHSLYLGIASFSFNEKIEQYAKDNGVAILRQKGEVVEIEADNLKAY